MENVLISLETKLQSEAEWTRDTAYKELKGLMKILWPHWMLERKIPTAPRLVTAYMSYIDKFVHGKFDKTKPTTECVSILCSLLRRAINGAPLSSIMGAVFNHVYDIIQSFALFEEKYYSTILPVLLEKDEYRMRMTKEQFSAFVQYLGSKDASEMTKEAYHRPLQSLIKKPPCDLDDPLRTSIVAAIRTLFICNFSNWASTFDSVIGLLKHDGANLGPLLANIHSVVGTYMYSHWEALKLQPDVKEHSVLYLRIQVNLRGASAGEARLLKLVEEELDMAWDSKAPVSKFHCSLLHLSARVIYEDLKRKPHANDETKIETVETTSKQNRKRKPPEPVNYTDGRNKRMKIETLETTLKDRIAKKKNLLWFGAACLLFKYYGSKLDRSLVYDLLNPSLASLESLSNKSIASGQFGGALWGLRCLSEACSPLGSGVPDNKNFWQSVWDAVLQRISLLAAVPELMQEALRLLAYLIIKTGVVPLLPAEFWGSSLFKEAPTSNSLLFVSALFSLPGLQLGLELRKSLLDWPCSIKPQNFAPLKLSCEALLAISTGNIHWPLNEMVAEAQCWWEEQDEPEVAALDQEEELLVASTESKPAVYASRKFVIKLCDMDILEVLEQNLLQLVDGLNEEPFSVSLQTCAMSLRCLKVLRTETSAEIWSPEGRLYIEVDKQVQQCATKMGHLEVDYAAHLFDECLEAMGELVSAYDVSNCTGLEKMLDVLGNLIRRESCTWKSMAIAFISRIGEILPVSVFHLLEEVIPTAKVWKCGEILLGMCKAVQISNPQPKFIKMLDIQNPFLKECILNVSIEMKYSTWKTRCELGNVMAKACRLFSEPDIALYLPKLLSDSHYQVRISCCRHIPVIFELNNHVPIFEEICKHLKVKLPMATSFGLVTSSEADKSSLKGIWTTTALLCLGEVALASQDAEAEAVYMILAQAALERDHRLLAAAILDNLSKRLGYPERFKYLEQHLRGVISRWVITKMPVSALVEIGDIIVPPSGLNTWLQSCTPFLLSYLILHDRADELDYLAKARSIPIKSLVTEDFGHILTTLLSFRWGDNGLDRTKFSEFLDTIQGPLLALSGLTKEERDKLLNNNMEFIVTQMLLLVNAQGSQSMSHEYTKCLTKSAALDVIKGLIELYSNLTTQEFFRPDRVFQILLFIHNRLSSAYHFRHRLHLLGKLETLVHIIAEDATNPSTFRYLLHVILQSIEIPECQAICCSFISDILKLENASIWILGDQLQALISKLVSCITSSPSETPRLMSLLRRLTVEADSLLEPFLKDIDTFPNIPCFEEIRKWQAALCSGSIFSAEFVKFVGKAPYLPSEQRFRSLQSFSEKLRADGSQEALSDEVVVAIWDLVLLSNEEDEHEILNLIAELLAAAGIANPDAVVFELPETMRTKIADTISINSKSGVSEEVVKMLLVQLCSSLMDQNAAIVQLACGTAKGLLSTAKGSSALLKLTTKVQSYLQVHKQGINLDLVNALLNQKKLTSSRKAKSINDPSLWATTGKTYSAWITTLVHSLIDCTEDPFLRLCQDFILVKATVAELLLPHVLGYLSGKLKTDSQTYKNIVSQVQAHIFCEANKNTRSIQLFVDAFNSLRSCYITARILPWPKVYWLDVDYLVTARAAQKCAAYFSSLIYVEHWCESNFGRLTLGDLQYNNELPEHLELLLNIRISVNEPDGAYGIVHIYKPASQVRLYEHEGNWSEAVQTYKLLLKSSAPPKEKIKYYNGMLKALYQQGCDEVYNAVCINLAKSNREMLRDTDFRELQYESAWRCGKWDLDMLTAESTHLQDCGFNGSLHSSFKCLLDGDSDRFPMHIKQMKADLVSHIMHTSLESTQNVYPSIVKLQAIHCLSEAWDLRWPACSPTPVVPSNDKVRKITTYWREMQNQTDCTYKILEPASTIFKVLLQVLQVNDQLPLQLMQHTRMARKAGKLNQAALAIQELDELFKKNPALKPRIARTIRIEKAKVLMAEGHRKMAVKLLKHLITQNIHSDELAELYCLTGKWVAQIKSESSRVIMHNYFSKSLDMAIEAGLNDSSARISIMMCKAMFHLAHYADTLFQIAHERWRSPEWQVAVELRKKREAEVRFVARMITLPNLTPDEKNSYQIKINEVWKTVKIDKEAERKLESDMRQFVLTCLANYRQCVLTACKYDSRVVFRLVSLWFNLALDEKLEKDFVEKIVEDMKTSASQIPSSKFVPLVYQIASRLKSDKDDFSSTIRLLVRRMVADHPYHTLYQLIALTNGDRIKSDQENKEVFFSDPDKQHVAEELVAELQSQKPELVTEMKTMVDMYIRLAELVVPEQVKNMEIPQDILDIRELKLVPVLTADIPIDHSCQYSENSFPHFKGFVDKLQIMNANNRPKVTMCQGSDGKRYRLLVKSGDDDLRQDAVMEQLFGHVNDMLKLNPETRKRSLQMRTYKVIPFSPSAGAIEWVEGTITLMDYLIGEADGGAHKRYGAGDWDFEKCWTLMDNSQNHLTDFQEICKNVRPVFRYFFQEKFKRAAEWFNKRLAYTRSVATSSMVGYIMGLGDRHFGNILMDKESAEVVHIDLGIAFEQGMLLTTPETVPFRLTRDIVDGMGVNGVEGVFRRCCEETLSVLRANKEALSTIVEVFMHDPLYNWALSPVKSVSKRQGIMNEVDVARLKQLEDDNEFGNKDAARALLRVKQKLDGLEGGEMRTVVGQVEQLIHDARDPERLCKLYSGWTAWL